MRWSPVTENKRDERWRREREGKRGAREEVLKVAGVESSDELARWPCVRRARVLEAARRPVLGAPASSDLNEGDRRRGLPAGRGGW